MFNKNLYFDIGATPLSETTALAMQPYIQEEFGNPESIHQAGQDAKKILNQSREKIAELIKAEPCEIIFTASATEADNLAIKGIALNHWRQTKGQLVKKQLLISPIEHPAIKEAATSLEMFGFQVIFLKVNQQGQIDLDDLQEKINSSTLLVSIIAANNQFGTIQDLRAIGAICRDHNVLFHTDASVYFGLYQLDTKSMKIDLATLSSPKIYGPKGVAALYCKKGIRLEPLLSGGGQEGNVRSGTHNLPAIVGFAAAAQTSSQDRLSKLKHYQELSDYFIQNLQKQLAKVQVNGDQKSRLANNVQISVLGVEGESLVLSLSQFGICASSGSACSSHKLQADPALKALGLSPEAIHGSLRFFWHEWTTKTELDFLLEKLIIVTKRLRGISAYKV